MGCWRNGSALPGANADKLLEIRVRLDIVCSDPL
jgi:hypothetical protein